MNETKKHLVFFDQDTIDWDVIPNVYRTNKKVDAFDYCNAWEVLNTGTTQVNVNGRPLYPGVPGTTNGDAVSYNGNRGEIYTGRIDIVFPAAGTGECIVTQKIYKAKKLN